MVTNQRPSEAAPCHTFSPQILNPLQLIHRLEGFRFLMRKCLLIIELSRSAYPVEDDSTTIGVLEKEEDGENQNRYPRGPKGR